MILPNERGTALSLVWRVFSEFEAPGCPSQGVTVFKEYITNSQETDNLNFSGAYIRGMLVGVIAVNNAGNHISLLFVEKNYQKRGIGTALLNHILKQSNSERITVNASTHAKCFYRKAGFVAASDTCQICGIRFIPMYYLREKWQFTD